MKISVLSENTSLFPEIKEEHGLSLFIQTEKTNILFDMGTGHILKHNTEKLGVDLSSIDFAVISHGHYDHGGGLPVFLSSNKTALVYICRDAFADLRSRRDNGEMAYIGLDQKTMSHERLKFVDEQYEIDENTTIFSNATGTYPRPSENDHLYVLADQRYIRDDFRHEQHLVLREGNRTLLIAGCAHSGIVNIIEHCNQTIRITPNAVIGGFHLYNHRTKKSEGADRIAALAERLLQTQAMFYTGHCTGVEAYHQLRAIMGDKIQYLSGGRHIQIE